MYNTKLRMSVQCVNRDLPIHDLLHISILFSAVWNWYKQSSEVKYGVYYVSR